MGNKRILVWGLSNNRAGTEAVIDNYASRVNGVTFDFLCYEAPLNYKNLFEGTSNRYYVIPIKIKHPFSYWKAIRSFFNKRKNYYDAVWINLNDLSNIDVLKLSYRLGIPRRIVHVHNSSLPNILITKVFSKLNWKKCLRLATDRWACSLSAGDFFFGDLPYRVVPNAVNSTSCAYDRTKRKDVRCRLGIQDRFVIGSVGRLVEQKNQRQLIEILPGLIQRRKDSILVIVGEGELHKDLAHLARRLGVDDYVIFAGSQQDIQSYLSAFDVFALPSHYEGLSLSLLEAQFNGLPCIVSDGVSGEAFISRSLQVVPLHDKEGWITALCQAERKPGQLIENVSAQYTLSHLSEVASTLFD